MQVLLVGPMQAAPFADIVATVRRCVPAGRVHTIGSLREISVSPAADLIVVLQQWPDEFPRAGVRALIDAAPFARLLVCYGPWCDSDGRTRDIWPLGTRVPTSAAPFRLIREIDEFRQERPPLPLTADRSEFYLRSLPLRRNPCDRPLRIVVDACDRALADALRDVLTDAGHWVAAAPAGLSCAANLLLWDADPWNESARERLRILREAHPEVPVAALSGFPRPHEERELRLHGVSAVLPKGADIDLLLASLQQVAQYGGSNCGTDTARPEDP